MRSKSNRRAFVIKTTSAVVFLSLPASVHLASCKSEPDKIPKNRSLILTLAGIIFPDTNDTSPGIREIGFARHLDFYLNDSNHDPDLQGLLIQRIEKFEKYLTKNKIRLEKLPAKAQRRLVEQMMREYDWFEKLISQIENIIIEACFLDPHYGVNKKQIGWKWVQHPFGTPRPDSRSDYFSLLQKRKKTEIIRSERELK